MLGVIWAALLVLSEMLDENARAMARLNGVPAIAAIFCLAIGACEDDAALFPPRPIDVPDPGDPGSMEPEPEEMEPPLASGNAPPDASSPAPVGMVTPTPSVEPAEMDAGVPGTEPDARPSPPAPTAVLVEGPPAELPRLGVAGGDPRLGMCEGGVLIGVRTTANPSLEVFGQRLTFVEPICGTALHQADPSGDSTGTISVTRDDARVAWSATDGFLGVPATEVPDPRLIWVLQPETVCPEATPVVVGFSGEYDPVAPDVVDTAAIRSLFIECAPLAIAPNGVDVVAAEADHQLVSHADSFAVSGGSTYRSVCEGGAVTTQVLVHAGFWLDGFVLGCSRLRVDE